LRAPVDAFFEGVMVNAEEMDLRLNRQGLLKTPARRDEPCGRPVPAGGLMHQLVFPDTTTHDGSNW
jgi:hypothetical protein